MFLPLRVCLSLILFYTCLPLRVGVLWSTPVWVWRDVQLASCFLLSFEGLLACGGELLIFPPHEAESPKTMAAHDTANPE